MCLYSIYDIYCIKGISPLKEHISKLIFKDFKKNKKIGTKYNRNIKKEKTLCKEKSNIKLIGNKKIQNPPKKLKDINGRTQINEKYKNKRKNILGKKSKLSLINQDSNLNRLKMENAQDDFINGFNKKSNSIIIASKAIKKEKNKEGKQRPEDLDMNELNNLEYDEACELDNRGYFY